MNSCRRCGGVVVDGKCSRCGLPEDFVSKCLRSSGFYYNRALDKAHIRDLSGCIEDCRKALTYNKYNSDARNLMGLCFSEMGEINSALSEWIVSANFQRDDNLANEYIQNIQDDQAMLDQVNKSVQKYNQALEHLKKDAEDLAFIALKSAVSVTPNFVKGHLLLALLYMRDDDLDHARKEIRKVLKIDANNTLALKYYKLVTGSNGSHRRTAAAAGTSGSRQEKRDRDRDAREETPRYDMMADGRMSIDEYVESSNNRYTFIGILVGLVVGVAVMWALIIPQKTSSLADSYKTLKREYSEEISVKNKDISSLEDDNNSLKSQVSDLTSQLKAATGDSGSGNIFENIINAAQYYMDDDNEKAAEYLVKVNENDIQSNVAKNLYNRLSDTVLPAVASESYNKGYSEFSSGNYDAAEKDLKTAIEYDAENVDAVYYLGRTYQVQGDYDKAKEQYEKIMNDFADSRRAAQAEQNIKIIGG